MGSLLVLGPVAFQGFEVPERITLGGRQRLAVHTLPGGTRIVDAMGPDDRELAWSGMISGIGADERVRQLDRLRQAGEALPLGWDGWRYTVVISRFEADSANPWWVPYRISCTVLSMGDLAVAEGLPSLATMAEAMALGAGPELESEMAAAAVELDSAELSDVAAAAGLLARLATARAYTMSLENKT